MIELKYNFEYFCSPVWIRETIDPNNVFKNISVENLPICEDLQDEIKKLDVLFQSTYNDNYPPEPIHMPIDEELNFCERVINSSLKLRELLPSYYKLSFNLLEWEKRIKEINNKINIKYRDTDINVVNRETNIIENEKITYSIISRGEMIINYSNNAINLSVAVTGELIFQPPTFYADLAALEKANLSEDIKKRIVNFIENDSEEKIGTKIIFD